MLDVIDCESAEAFLEALAPVSPYFRSPDPSRDTILFRGCGDASWRLIPSALRDAAGRTLRHQVRVETDALGDFVSECDENGLPIPNDSPSLRAEIISLRRPGAQPPLWLEAGVTWPTDHWLALMALAQHSGLKTRLLDWTTSPYVAAYFAARADSSVSPDAKLAVWALSPFQAKIVSAPPGSSQQVMFASGRSVSKFFWMKDWRGFAVVDTTRAGNPNLVAQRGYLTAHLLGAVSSERWEEPWDEPPLEDLVDAPPSPSRLRKFVLHRRHAPLLLEFLKRYGVSTATMFPGYAGIAKSVLEKPPRSPYDI